MLGERATSVAVLRPKRLFGETLGASEGLGLLAALAAGTGGIALVNAFQMGGSVASFVVRVGEHS